LRGPFCSLKCASKVAYENALGTDEGLLSAARIRGLAKAAEVNEARAPVTPTQSRGDQESNDGARSDGGSTPRGAEEDSEVHENQSSAGDFAGSEAPSTGH
jgi:hypothetical protein